MQDNSTIGEVLAASGPLRLDAELLLVEVLGCARSTLHAYPERRLSRTERLRYQALMKRRRQGEPLAYLTGTREFWSLRLHVTPDVLVPRPETEGVVERVLALTPATACRIADLGTGSGAIALALASERPDARLTATDASEAALAVAQDNARRLGLHRIRFLKSDWFAALEGERFHVIASNPPYVADDDPRETGLAFEPAGALGAGDNGLAELRRIISAAPRHLLPGGWLVLEHGAGQAEAVHKALADTGFEHIRLHRDLAGLPRISEGRLGAT